LNEQNEINTKIKFTNLNAKSRFSFQTFSNRIRIGCWTNEMKSTQKAYWHISTDYSCAEHGVPTWGSLKQTYSWLCRVKKGR
jgi:hypothetical protein